jgi:hypothetical protein
LPMFWAHEMGCRRKYWPHDLSCRKPYSIHWHTIKLQGKTYFSYLLDTSSRKVQKFKKPCGRTTQFSAALHCQAQNQHRTELVKGEFRASHICPGCHLPPHTCYTVLSCNPPAGLHNAHGLP